MEFKRYFVFVPRDPWPRPGFTKKPLISRVSHQGRLHVLSGKYNVVNGYH